MALAARVWGRRCDGVEEEEINCYFLVVSHLST